MVCRCVRALELHHAALHLLARIGQLRGHVGERARQAAELVARGEHRLGAEVAGGHLAHAVGQQQQRPRELVAQQAASSTAPNTARISASVSVPMYMRRRPSRASARCWYSL
jgi:hypothetical protein